LPEFVIPAKAGIQVELYKSNNNARNVESQQKTSGQVLK